MKRSVMMALVAMTLLVVADAQTTVAPGAKKPCLQSGGVAINLNGNFGFCYLKGRRMRPGSVFAQCQDGVLKCFEDEGIPDKPRRELPCIAPEQGNCGSDKDATPAPSTAPAPTPTPSMTGSSGGGNATRSYDPEVGDDKTEERSISTTKHTVNPSALVAGNLPNGEIYDDDDDNDDVYR